MLAPKLPSGAEIVKSRLVALSHKDVFMAYSRINAVERRWSLGRDWRPRVPGLELRQRLLWHVVRWYAHRELPSFGHLLHWYGMNDQWRWAEAPTVEIRGRFFGHKMRLDLPDFYQRIAYFFGCYHEHDVLSACEAALRPGEVFVDGGANIGLVTMHAAGIVGPRGAVHAFECSPRVLDRLRYHIAENKLSQVQIHEAGLSDVPGSLPLRLPHLGNEAAATFAPLPARYGDGWLDLGTAPLVRGDDVLDASDDRPLVIKLDVEGFEVRALKGLLLTIRRRRPALITEVNSELLETAGESVQSLTSLLKAEGYKPFAIDRGGFRLRHRLLLHPLVGIEVGWERDVMWLAPGSLHWDRLAPIMVPRGLYWRHLQAARTGYVIPDGDEPGAG